MMQRGFTLIELLVALAVGSLVVVGALGGIHQVVWGTSRTNSQVVALNEVNRAALFIKNDLSTYNDADLTVVPPDLITISWEDKTDQTIEATGKTKVVTYRLSGTELTRIFTVDDVLMPEQIVGRHITYLSFTREEGSRFIDVVITATEGDMTPRTETISFSVYQLKEEKIPE